MPLVSVSQAVRLLKSEEVVALPTETVYGLAGIISSAKALHSIFSIKKRPFFDPLIVHVLNSEQALNLAHFDEISLRLANHFWPGPLTLVLPKKEKVSDLITSGRQTVALRSPAHPLFRKVLEALGSSLAVPSANRFGQTSSTRAEHIFDEFDKEIPVLDGGPCSLGIESTVIELNGRTRTLEILRPGPVGPASLNFFFENQRLSVRIQYKPDNKKAPGHLKNHYQPKIPFVLILEENSVPGEKFLKTIMEKVKRPLVQWSLPEDPKLSARRLYGDLRTFSEKNQACYFIFRKKWLEVDHWHSLFDRLKKAAHYMVFKKEGDWTIDKKDECPLPYKDRKTYTDPV